MITIGQEISKKVEVTNEPSDKGYSIKAVATVDNGELKDIEDIQVIKEESVIGSIYGSPLVTPYLNIPLSDLLNVVEMYVSFVNELKETVKTI